MSIISWMLIFINLVLFLIQTQVAKTQDLSDVDLNVPINVEQPQNKQDFIQQCSRNIQSQGTPASQADSYCQCSANAVYAYQSRSNSDISSDGAVLDAILQCRVKNIKD